MSVRKSSGEEMAVEKRPLGVSIVGVGFAIFSSLGAIAGLKKLVDLCVNMDVGFLGSPAVLSNVILSPIMTLVLLAGSVGILMGRNWGRILFIVWCLFSVGINLLNMMMNWKMVETLSSGNEVSIFLVILFLVYGISIYILLSPKANRFFRSSLIGKFKRTWRL